ncbi:retron system putative HNH endonuclease [Magnetococcus sp. PR-3]|uniref:retron system putative HNH endonuclease n=1 Tax=Magnetococcus sp. PR-3 TaxID=3120355 RepID=UPI002FCDFF11
MKPIVKQAEPAALTQFRQIYPEANWEGLRQANPPVYPHLKAQLRQDQGGLCAYCEIDLKPKKSPQEVDDFRIEHFHPKSDIHGHWTLNWSNMLGVCHGGSQRRVTESGQRFTENKRDHSCDVPKGAKALDDIILNPLNIPKTPALFHFDRAMGSMRVDQKACAQTGISAEKAQATIDHLHLNSSRLLRMRQQVLDHLNEQLMTLMDDGLTLQQARDRLALAYLSKNHEGLWPVAFFSAIRHYLGQSAESQLTKENSAPSS